MNIITKLEELNNLYNKALENMQKCSICGGTGKLPIEDEIIDHLRINKKIQDDEDKLTKVVLAILKTAYKYCDCVYINENYTIYDLEKDIKRLKIIINDLPDEYKNSNIYVNDTILDVNYKIIWIHGISGSGKTALLYHLQAINRFYGKKEEIKNFYDLQSKFYDFFDLEISADILAIDDLDVVDKFNYQRFFNFLYNSKYNIYITSIYSFKDFIKIINLTELDKQRILSRLAYSVYEIKTKDIDYRIKK